MTSTLKGIRAGYLLLSVFTFLFACKKSGTTNPDNPLAKTPVVESIIPNRGLAGDTVIITGANFSTIPAENFVRFNGTQATVMTATATKLTVKAPQGGTSGNIEIQVKNSQLVVGGMFTYTGVLSISAITPMKAQAGDSVVITGTNFRARIEDNTVLFNGVKAVITAANANKLTVIVPQGATSGKIQVMVDKQTATIDLFTVVSFPATLSWQEVEIPLSLTDVMISASKGNIVLFYLNTTTSGLYRLEDGRVTAIAKGGPMPLKSTEKNFFGFSDYKLLKSADGTNWVTALHHDAVSHGGFITTEKKVTVYAENLSQYWRYTSINEGETWSNSRDPIADALKYPGPFTKGYPYDYLTDTDHKIYYCLVIIDHTTDKEIYKSIDGGDTWIKETGNLYALFTKNAQSKLMIAGAGNNLLCAFNPLAYGSPEKIYRSVNNGASWVKLNDDKVNILKTTGGYVVYGADYFNLSFNKGASFIKYAIPPGNILKNVEIANQTVYIFCKNQNMGTTKIFRANL